MNESEIRDFIKYKSVTAEWRARIDFIDHLRILNKFRSSIVNHYLDTYCQDIQDALVNLRSQIQKTAMFLIQELFLYEKQDNKLTLHFLQNILPTVF